MTAQDEWITAGIVATRDLTPDIREFRIAPARAMPVGAPGAHIAVQLPTPHGTMVRTYSLLDGGDAAPYRIAVKRLMHGRGGSAALWQMAPGDQLSISGPRNTFPLRPDAAFCLLIAGGIGITALTGMARALAESGRAFRLLYAVRTQKDLAFANELLQFAGDQLSIFVSADGNRLDLTRTFASLPQGAEAYVCGPPGMMMAARAAWLDAGRPMVGAAVRDVRSRRIDDEPGIYRLCSPPRSPYYRKIRRDSSRSLGAGRNRHDLRLSQGRVRLVCAARAFHRVSDRAPRFLLLRGGTGSGDKTLHMRFTDSGWNAGSGYCRPTAAHANGCRRVSRPRAPSVARIQLALREMIVQGELQPGDRVTELAMVARLGLSRTPVRTALMRLQDEGLLEALPGGGFAVATFSETDVYDTIELRGTLEGLAARLAAERCASPACLMQLRTHLDTLDAALAADGEAKLIAAYVEHNAAFHAVLCELCASAPLIKQIERVNALPFASPSALVALNSDPLGARHVFTIAQHQHRSLLEAIERRQGTRAEAIAREHARLSVTNLQRIFAGKSGAGTVPISLVPHRWAETKEHAARS